MKTTFAPICADCNVKFIVTKFCNSTVRLLCPKCQGILSGVIDDKHGFRKIVRGDDKGCDGYIRKD